MLEYRYFGCPGPDVGVYIEEGTVININTDWTDKQDQLIFYQHIVVGGITMRGSRSNLFFKKVYRFQLNGNLVGTYAKIIPQSFILALDTRIGIYVGE